MMGAGVSNRAGSNDGGANVAGSDGVDDAPTPP
jgi:hypothetical protein